MRVAAHILMLANHITWRVFHQKQAKDIGYFKMLVYTFIMFFQGNGNVHNKLTIVTDEPRHEK